MTPLDRRRFLEAAAATGLASSLPLPAQNRARSAHAETQHPTEGVAIPDDGWLLSTDRAAQWEDDEIFLPNDVELSKLPENSPTEGWNALYTRKPGEHCLSVNLPATVEQNFWGKYGKRAYTPEEYRYAADDPVPQNGAYRGVSWFYRTIDISFSVSGKRLLLHIRGARMRAEVYLNGQLVGYSIVEELPFQCDLTKAAHPGGVNQLAIRITNPGGRYDWVDGTTIRWGKVNLYRSHGFGGLDRGLTLRAVPLQAHIEDAWVLNTSEPRAITVRIKLAGNSGGAPVLCEVVEPSTGKVLYSASAEAAEAKNSDGAQLRASLHCPAAQLWDLDTPTLYHLRVTQRLANGQADIRTIVFGFRSFAPEGLGSDAIFRLNGRRLKIYTSISWGFWGHNGLFPTPELAEREVTQAKRLNLNCLNFHRNVGKEDVMRAHDRLGLLRYMEPGGGKLAIGKLPSGAIANAAGIVMEPPRNAADRFSRDFMLEKCRAMVRAFRSHPSLIQYTLQNEIGADLRNPDTFTAIDIMHAEDPSRSVVLNDGFSPPPRSAPQAWYSPYNDTMHRSDRENWGGWWNNHQGAGDQWYDAFYKDAEHFTYRQPLKDVLVEFGEMEGCAVADNHPLMVHQIESRQLGGNGRSYDLEDHREIITGLDRFLDRWGFRKAFPTAEGFYRMLGDKCYQSWQQYMENIRICDEIDFAAISGWESTAIENHSGIVDNLRNFKGDPDLIASSLMPIRPVAKQHALCYAIGQSAVFDLYLLNDTGRMPKGKLRFTMVDPAKKRIELGSWDVPEAATDRFSYTVQTAFNTPPLMREGIYRFQFTCEGAPASNFSRELWVSEAKPKLHKPLKIGVSGVLRSLRTQLEALPGLEITEFSPGERFDVIVASGVVKGSKLDRQIGDETGLESPVAKGAPVEQQTPGQLDSAVLNAVKAGTPLLAAVPDDFLADGVAKQLSALGAFTYTGQVGDTRAPWMGNWLFVREHATFAGLPANRVMGVHYQAHGKQSNGLLVERAANAPELEVIMGYSRDHDRQVGAASFVCHVGPAPVLLHRAPEFSAPLQARWLANTLSFLTGQPLA